jgi:hypothetical protein
MNDLKKFLENGDLTLIDIKEELQNEFNFSGVWSIWEQKKAIIVQFVDDFMASELKKRGFIFSAKSNKFFLFLGE